MSNKTKNEAKLAEEKRQKIISGIAISISLIAVAVLLGIAIWWTFDDSDTKKPAANSKITLSDTATYYADIDIKDYGKITVKLDYKAAPLTVENFVNLANNKFYDGLTFHRIIEDFMMQGGAYNKEGTTKTTHTIKGEFSLNGIENNLSHTRGAISMARNNDMNSASSQFFIVHKDSTFLDGNYAAFGYVESGMDVVDAICTSAEPSDNNGTIPLQERPIINTVTIRTVE